MMAEGQILGESDFRIVDKDELERMKQKGKLTLDGTPDKELLKGGGNLKDDLIKLGFLDYDNLSEEEKKIFDELENETRDDFYELD